MPAKPKFALWPRPAAPLPQSLEERRGLYLRLARENEVVMLRVAMRLAGQNRDLADDIVQESVIAGWRLFCEGRVVDESCFRSWILRIVLHRFLNSSRKLRREDLGLEVEELEDHQSASSDALQKLVRQEVGEELSAAIEQLSFDHQAVLILIDIEELDYSEAAEALNVPVGTIRSRLSRARHALGRQLGPNWSPR